MMLPADEVLPEVLPVAAPSKPPNTLAMVEPVLVAAALLAVVVADVDVVVADVAEEVAPVVPSTEVDVDFLVEVLGS